MLSVVMLNVTYKPFVLNVVMLSVLRWNVVMLSVVAPVGGWSQNSLELSNCLKYVIGALTALLKKSSTHHKFGKIWKYLVNFLKDTWHPLSS